MSLRLLLPALALAAACGPGTTSTGVPTGTSTGEPGGKKGKNKGEPCLDIGTMTMDMQFGWDATTGRTAPAVDGNTGLPELSYFQVNLGSPEWDGDTSLPGAPDRWCFVRWGIDGWADDGLGTSAVLSMSGIEVGRGVTNCGRESAPGASDFVPLCGDYFGDDDPVAVMSPNNWGFHFGGALDPSVQGIPSYFAPAGYTPDNFWGSDVTSSLFTRVDTLTFGWAVDEQRVIKVDEDNAPVKLTRAEFEDPQGVPSGLYVHVIPWIFRL